jgi:hypothetical protein
MLQNNVLKSHIRILLVVQYDMPDITREGDLHIAGDMKVAWFKDPNGNILNIVNR